PETLVAAFRATLEEISDSDMLVHVVDAANPQALAHIESVDKILHELQLNNIPRLIVLNKADLLDKISLEALERTILFDKDRESMAVSAIQPKTLKPLLERIGAVLQQRPDVSRRQSAVVN
ncbi:MAG: GTPase HflX, partial [Acidobacteria bacterium]|nr:GTPase HflX [Acidobacteriota bacterium]